MPELSRFYGIVIRMYFNDAEWAAPQDGFSCIQFDRTDPDRNCSRFYYLSWQPTLVDTGAVVRKTLCNSRDGGTGVSVPLGRSILD